MNTLALIVGYIALGCVALLILACLVYVGYSVFIIFKNRFTASKWVEKQIAKNNLLLMRDATSYIAHRYDFPNKDKMNIYELAEYFRHKEQGEYD